MGNRAISRQGMSLLFRFVLVLLKKRIGATAFKFPPTRRRGLGLLNKIDGPMIETFYRRATWLLVRDGPIEKTEMGVQRFRLACKNLTCSRLSVIRDEQTKKGEREKKRGKTNARKGTLVLNRSFSHSASFLRSSTATESLEQASKILFSRPLPLHDVFFFPGQVPYTNVLEL